ncbi:MAG: D-glycero-beta-D-manno-heptose 1-phosphate adenylyltransferase [Ignavibacteriae bacterium]|nr:D-glycero-beta-D-manno-heptose 1-phosphate adenylyltransferase [Ignavibacteriota bacterium]
MVYELKDFLVVREKLKEQNKKLVFTNGCFDILHRGHVEYLKQAKSLGDYLVVGLNSDSSVKMIKDESRPINNENDRAFVLDSLKVINAVIIFSEDTPYNIIKEIVPDYLVKGGDWTEDNIVGADVVKKAGGKVVSLKYVDNYSTTSTINKLRKLGN